MPYIQIKITGSSEHLMKTAMYKILKASLLTCARTAVLISFPELLLAVAADLKKHKHIITGSLEWHLSWVALDLEKRHELARIRSGESYSYGLPRYQPSGTRATALDLLKAKIIKDKNI